MSAATCPPEVCSFNTEIDYGKNGVLIATNFMLLKSLQKKSCFVIIKYLTFVALKKWPQPGIRNGSVTHAVAGKRGDTDQSSAVFIKETQRKAGMQMPKIQTEEAERN